MLNTPPYKLAKYLDIIIKLHIPNQYCVEKYKEFLKKLSKYERKYSDYCISFDVVSLFTNAVVVKVYTSVHETIFGVHKIFRVHKTHLGVHKILRLQKKIRRVRLSM